MPLAFESESHGPIAFGFFNIETDMLLLEHYFFFASDFCRGVARLAVSQPKRYYKKLWEIYDIPVRDIGDLQGAISGIHLIGFIGEVYENFAFPHQPEGFKQNPDGFLTRPVIEKIVTRYGEERATPFKVDGKKERVAIGEYRFTFAGFHALLRYVWRGGYPRWKDEIRPEYVLKMKTAIEKSQWPLFKDLKFEI